MTKITAGIPTADTQYTHAQMALNIVKIGKPVSTVITTVYSRRDAARWLYDHGISGRHESGLRLSFRNGGRIYEAEGYRVVKTMRQAPHRSVYNDATRKDAERRIRHAEKIGKIRRVIVTEWRKV